MRTLAKILTAVFLAALFFGGAGSVGRPAADTPWGGGGVVVTPNDTPWGGG